MPQPNKRGWGGNKKGCLVEAHLAFSLSMQRSTEQSLLNNNCAALFHCFLINCLYLGLGFCFSKKCVLNTKAGSHNIVYSLQHLAQFGILVLTSLLGFFFKSLPISECDGMERHGCKSCSSTPLYNLGKTPNHSKQSSSNPMGRRQEQAGGGHM